jgi:hypothetical protein
MLGTITFLRGWSGVLGNVKINLECKKQSLRQGLHLNPPLSTTTTKTVIEQLLPQFLYPYFKPGFILIIFID